MKTFIKGIGSLLSWLIIAAGILAVAVVIAFTLFGAKFAMPLTPSMTASGMPPGTGVVALPIEASDIKSGDDILAVSPYRDPVLHKAHGEPFTDGAGRIQLSMKGTSNDAHESYVYDVTDGAHKVVWHVPGLGSVIKAPWAAIPGTQELTAGNSGLPWAIIPLALLPIWAFWVIWRARNRRLQEASESAHELEASAN